MLVTYNAPLPRDGSGFIDALPPAVIDAVDRGQVPRFQYGAVLVDEGHDFEPDWYRLIVQMIDPQTNSLLVLYDDAQNIYGNASRRKVSWKSLGVQAQGRTTILKLNYRNTLEILSVARRFAAELLAERSDDDDGVPLLAPESAGRRGAVPELIRATSPAGEIDAAITHIRDEQARGRPLSDIAVIHRHNWQGDALRQSLDRVGIACCRADDRGGKDALFRDEGIKLVTMHSSKGLEFPIVLVTGLGQLPGPHEDEAAAARLLYVAMTRATERLLLLHHGDSVFTTRIRASINEVQAQIGASS